MLDGGRAVAGQGKHLLAGQGELHRPAVAALGSQGRKHHMGVRQALGTEAAAHMRGDDVDLPGLQGEQRCHGLPHRVDSLGGVVQRQFPAGPYRHGGVRLHGVVVFRRGPVAVIDDHRRIRQRGLNVTHGGVRRDPAIGLGRCVQPGMLRGEKNIVFLGFVVNEDQGCRMARCLRGPGNDSAHELTAEPDLGALQHGVFRIFAHGQPRRILVGEHGDDAIDRRCRGGVDPADTSLGDARLDRVKVDGVIHRLVIGVGRGAAHLLHPV
ncbi:hypothetical protein ADIAG_02222 [Paeniglutamicibacter gangotriensis Lz1y]|uniref:Uncharacterized protein n=1 Tax=Paeniglutamicibacter gangotriensis Lz1y TaxID=1276920 RepID=M7MT65_9MICC|nr:hypothetical protein ADIAG_02222 [Paeniglutamicibacter gangotriensis Lz1y]